MTWAGCTCPTCKTKYWSILETRKADDGPTRRRHLCHNGHRFTTYTDASGLLVPAPARTPRRSTPRRRNARNGQFTKGKA